MFGDEMGWGDERRQAKEDEKSGAAYETYTGKRASQLGRNRWTRGVSIVKRRGRSVGGCRLLVYSGGGRVATRKERPIMECRQDDGDVGRK